MFDYCVHAKAKCPSAGFYKNILHCGEAGKRVSELKECAMKKKGKKKRPR